MALSPRPLTCSVRNIVTDAKLLLRIVCLDKFLCINYIYGGQQADPRMTSVSALLRFPQMCRAEKAKLDKLEKARIERMSSHVSHTL